MDYEPITHELREAVTYRLDGVNMIKSTTFNDLCDNIDAIHRSLEAENERLRDASERGDDWIKLPVDADGAPIHIGDGLWSDNGVWVKVERLQFENGKWAVFVEDKAGISFYAIVEDMHHYRSDTWERIIEDAIDSVDGGPTIAALVARCKALCERTREGEE